MAPRKEEVQVQETEVEEARNGPTERDLEIPLHQEGKGGLAPPHGQEVVEEVWRRTSRKDRRKSPEVSGRKY